jgi:hypothetical protein
MMLGAQRTTVNCSTHSIRTQSMSDFAANPVTRTVALLIAKPF